MNGNNAAPETQPWHALSLRVILTAVESEPRNAEQIAKTVITVSLWKQGKAGMVRRS